MLSHSVAAATYSGPDKRFMIRTIGNPKSPRWSASLIHNSNVVEKYCCTAWLGRGLIAAGHGDTAPWLQLTPIIWEPRRLVAERAWDELSALAQGAASA